MDNTEAKDKILDTVVNIMQQGQDIEKLTNRQIAEKAGVNSALINYYYKSKDNLLLEAVNVCMGNLFENIIQKTSKEIDPLVRLKSLINEILSLGYAHYPLAKITVTNELSSGGIITNKMIQPVLKEIFQQSKTEYEIKILAAQLLLPIQVVFLNATAYQKYLECDIQNVVAEQDKLIDVIFKNLSIGTGGTL